MVAAVAGLGLRLAVLLSVALVAGSEGAGLAAVGAVSLPCASLAAAGLAVGSGLLAGLLGEGLVSLALAGGPWSPAALGDASGSDGAAAPVALSLVDAPAGDSGGAGDSESGGGGDGDGLPSSESGDDGGEVPVAVARPAGPGLGELPSAASLLPSAASLLPSAVLGGEGVGDGDGLSATPAGASVRARTDLWCTPPAHDSSSTQRREGQRSTARQGGPPDDGSG
jgi:hypothetical protein